jgi:hypothetical protein
MMVMHSFWIIRFAISAGKVRLSVRTFDDRPGIGRSRRRDELTIVDLIKRVE